jgi:Phasin protein
MSARTNDATNLQKELLDAYEQANRAWLERVKSEMELWSELATKLSTTRSVPEALGVYQKSMAQRMQMAAEDGRKLFDECRNITQKITRAMSSGRSPGST